MATIWVLVRDGEDTRRYERTDVQEVVENIERDLRVARRSGRPARIVFEPDGGDPLTFAADDLLGVWTDLEAERQT